MADEKIEKKDDAKKEAPPWKPVGADFPEVVGAPPTFPPAPSAYDVEQQRLAQWRAGQGVASRPADGVYVPQPDVSVGAPGSAERRLAIWQAQYARQAAIEARQQ